MTEAAANRRIDTGTEDLLGRIQDGVATHTSPSPGTRLRVSWLRCPGVRPGSSGRGS
jgi:hypothetical protein